MPKKKSGLQQILGLVGAGTTALFFTNTVRRYNDTIVGQDDFSEHTKKQHLQHLFSGMHEPLMPNAEQLSIFKQFFSPFSHLLPTNLTSFKQEQALKTPVRFRPLSECSAPVNFKDAQPLVVGGFPALMSAVSLLLRGQRITYLHDNRRRPIAYGSAWHLEQDAETEAPTTYQPIRFFGKQAVRTVLQTESQAAIEASGLFPWRTLDWMGWLRHPEHWLAGLKLGAAFQSATMMDPQQRATLMRNLAKQCKANEKFLETLDHRLNHTLLLPGHGSIIVARNEEEVAELLALKKSLEQEDRTLTLLSKEDVADRYGFVPTGLMFAEKRHDRVLSPHFMDLLTQFIRKEGGRTINGTLTTIYTDEQHSGGIAEYQMPGGQKDFIPFSQLTLSLGSQPLFDKNDQPLFDVVSARGVSVLAHVYVPRGIQLPPLLVCGGTNHVTKLSTTPVSITHKDGKAYDLYLTRITAGACITPNVSDEDSANYDGTIAVGLISAVRKTFGDHFKVEPISIYGCNRQVSKFGQTQWINPYPGIYIQYGAGGGGLTRGPDLAVQQENISYKL